MEKGHITELIKKYNITNLADNSRLVKNNDCFFAIKGHSFNGEEYAKEAETNGATLVISENKIPNLNITNILVENIRDIIPIFCQEVYKNLPKNLVAVTGTNGKTSIAQFYSQLCKLVGIKCASIGTLGVEVDGKKIAETINTTPNIIKLYQLLSLIKNSDIDDVIIEASSIGLEQKRLHGLNFKAAAFTNLSYEHLDYHKDMNNYFLSKKILFDDLVTNSSFAVINSDDISSKKIVANSKAKVISYGNKSPDLKLNSIKNEGLTTDFQFTYKNQILQCHSNLIGNFQVYNLLCTIGLMLCIFGDEKLKDYIDNCKNIEPADGRLSLVKQQNGVAYFIDYAHTPDALENILVTLKNYCKNNLWLVFGCGGNRDKPKRRDMGEIAYKFCDKIIITDDNPRDEKPEDIRNEIASACPNAINIGDRAKAIAYAADNAKENDIVVIAGKGHENYQIIGNNKLHFNDKEEILKNLS